MILILEVSGWPENQDRPSWGGNLLSTDSWMRITHSSETARGHWDCKQSQETHSWDGQEFSVGMQLVYLRQDSRWSIMLSSIHWCWMALGTDTDMSIVSARFKTWFLALNHTGTSSASSPVLRIFCRSQEELPEIIPTNILTRSACHGQIELLASVNYQPTIINCQILHQKIHHLNPSDSLSDPPHDHWCWSIH